MNEIASAEYDHVRQSPHSIEGGQELVGGSQAAARVEQSVLTLQVGVSSHILVTLVARRSFFARASNRLYLIHDHTHQGGRRLSQRLHLIEQC